MYYKPTIPNRLNLLTILQTNLSYQISTTIDNNVYNFLDTFFFKKNTELVDGVPQVNNHTFTQYDSICNSSLWSNFIHYVHNSTNFILLY